MHKLFFVAASLVALCPACGTQAGREPATQETADANVAAQDIPQLSALLKDLQAVGQSPSEQPTGCLNTLANTLAPADCCKNIPLVSFAADPNLPLTLRDAMAKLFDINHAATSGEGKRSCWLAWMQKLQQRMQDFHDCVKNSFECTRYDAWACMELSLSAQVPLTASICVSPALKCDKLSDSAHPDQLAHCYGTQPGILGSTTGVASPGAAGPSPASALSGCTRGSDCLVVQVTKPLPDGVGSNSTGAAIGLEIRCRP